MTTHAHCAQSQQLLASDALTHVEAGLTIQIIGDLGTAGDTDLRVAVAIVLWCERWDLSLSTVGKGALCVGGHFFVPCRLFSSVCLPAITVFDLFIILIDVLIVSAILFTAVLTYLLDL